ncbi:hypothetical protein G6O69_24715 [Pseudenhygromyxa sp. WMMC2535]|nr:hypothetical protein [Pseudenhygromyxa sp. WMMC2535]
MVDAGQHHHDGDQARPERRRGDLRFAARHASPAAAAAARHFVPTKLGDVGPARLELEQLMTARLVVDEGRALGTPASLPW